MMTVFHNLNNEGLRDVLAFIERTNGLAVQHGEPVERIAGQDSEPEPIITEMEPSAPVPAPVKRSRKKTEKGNEETQAALNALLPPPPAPAETVEADPQSVFKSVLPPVTPPPAPAPVPPAPAASAPAGGMDIPGFMNVAIAAIREQKKTHQQVMDLLKSHGIQGFHDLEGNVDKLAAIAAQL